MEFLNLWKNVKNIFSQLLKNTFTFIIKGYGIYYIENGKYSLKNRTFIRISSGKKHKLICKASSKENLEFVYFEIAE